MGVKRFGCFGNQNEVSTHGTGFFVEYNNRYYFITCKHVVEKCNSRSYFFMKYTTNREIPNYIELYSSLEKVYYSSNDTDTLSSDIAVFEISDNTIKSQDIKVFNLETHPDFENLSVRVCGYANQYILDNAKSMEVKFPPLCLDGIIKKTIQIDGVTYTNLPYAVKNPKAGLFLNSDYSNLEGISGGAVISKIRGSVVGIIFATGSMGMDLNSSNSIDFFAFISSQDIRDVLDEMNANKLKSK